MSLRDGMREQGLVPDLLYRGGPFRAENGGPVARWRRVPLVPRGRGL